MHYISRIFERLCVYAFMLVCCVFVCLVFVSNICACSLCNVLCSQAGVTSRHVTREELADWSALSRSIRATQSTCVCQEREREIVCVLSFRTPNYSLSSLTPTFWSALLQPFRISPAKSRAKACDAQRLFKSMHTHKASLSRPFFSNFSNGVIKGRKGEGGGNIYPQSPSLCQIVNGWWFAAACGDACT